MVVPGTDRWRIRLAAASAKGLREVRIYDGRDVAYRFDAGGKKEFVTEIDGHHDRQHHWVPVVEDMEGKLAIGPVFGTTRSSCAFNKWMATGITTIPSASSLTSTAGRKLSINTPRISSFKGKCRFFVRDAPATRMNFMPPGLDATEMSWYWVRLWSLKSEPAEPPLSGWACGISRLAHPWRRSSWISGWISSFLPTTR